MLGSVECEDSGISMAGIIVCGVVLLLAAVIAIVYIGRRRSHRNLLTKTHAHDVFMRLMKKKDVRMRIGIAKDGTGKIRRGLMTSKIKEAVLEYQNSLKVSQKEINKTADLDEREGKFVAKKETVKRLRDALDKRLIEDPADTLGEEDLLKVAVEVSEGRSGSAGFQSKRETFQMIEHAFKTKYHQDALDQLKACFLCHFSLF